MVVMLIVTAIPFVSASTLLDTEKKVSITVNCSKPGYKFEIYQVASLDNKATTTYETVYTPFFDDIAASVKKGETKGILSDLDNLFSLPKTAVSYGIFNSSEKTAQTFDNLEQGIYYIKTVAYPAGVKRVENSVVALPYYSNGWVYSVDDIELASKVQDEVPETHKEITNSTRNNVNFTDVSIGDTVAFKLTNTTAGSASIKLTTYAVYDDMSKGLTLDNNSFTVYLANKDGENVETLASTDYNVNITNQKSGENTTFNVALTKDYLAKDNFYQSNVVSMIVTYTAKLNEYAVKGISGNPNEDVELEYGNTSTVDKVPGNTVYIYTYGVLTNKLDENGTVLAGATFGLYKTEDDATAQTNEIARGTSDSNGKVSFINLDNNEISLESGNYFIMELEAPEGYNVYSQVIPISIDVSYNEIFTNNTWVQNAPANGYANCTVTDTAVVLPQTGGNIIMVYIAGGICVLTAVGLFAVLFIISKKRKSTVK